ncbi:hypothetical protein MBM_09271 [Drepanopeziza brunnea f. sp. 'multigermtubi' MB_m1]|uniref:Uncharacterized protein n=1 Tax=Marssonina brunnea f. sp. multigermtubi (strain MB_m1) TaxID=1072389 RepID=K1WKF5_MARBU|nr:uncharacterized protein MBM_09271 [Drepanopeziza brunnea f. sp. 'multigermtubi' MB_m1]EKD12702.1 hypothetical protein MBM_09271 [Drepanopeziza brunnea f. sp. 'multigermtubi' MB_m1]
MATAISVRFLLIPDTHPPSFECQKPDGPFRGPMPKADVALHGGNLRQKLVIAGNHDPSPSIRNTGRTSKTIEDEEEQKKPEREGTNTPRRWTSRRGKLARDAGVADLDEAGACLHFTLRDRAQFLASLRPRISPSSATGRLRTGETKTCRICRARLQEGRPRSARTLFLSFSVSRYSYDVRAAARHLGWMCRRAADGMR